MRNKFFLLIIFLILTFLTVFGLLYNNVLFYKMPVKDMDFSDEQFISKNSAYVGEMDRQGNYFVYIDRDKQNIFGDTAICLSTIDFKSKWILFYAKDPNNLSFHNEYIYFTTDSYLQIRRFNVKDGTLKTIVSGSYSDYLVYKDKICYSLCNGLTDQKNGLYLCELDGSNSKLIMKGRFLKILADNESLYAISDHEDVDTNFYTISLDGTILDTKVFAGMNNIIKDSDEIIYIKHIDKDYSIVKYNLLNGYEEPLYNVGEKEKGSLNEQEYAIDNLFKINNELYFYKYNCIYKIKSINEKSEIAKLPFSIRSLKCIDNNIYILAEGSMDTTSRDFSTHTFKLDLGNKDYKYIELNQ